MKELLKKKLQEKMANSEGFTLLEILVVLTIMGFLIAMVGPRLAGVSSDAVDTVCDTNQNRMVTYMGAYFEKTNRFPDKLTNLVEETGANAYQIPAVSDDDPDNGPETLASEFMSRNHLRVHYLNDAEAAVLKNMGVVNLFNLNAYDAYDDTGAIKATYDGTAATGPVDVDLVATPTQAPTMEEVTVPLDTTTTPFAVAMIGMGYDGAAWDVDTTERGWGEPGHLGRIILGMSAESGLITSGVIANAAHCPGGLQNADNATYNDYNVVLPRLEATAARITNALAATAGWTAIDLENVVAIAYDDEPAAGYVPSTNLDNLRYRTFDLTEAQESYQFATQCPEGHMYSEDDGEFWGIDLVTDDSI